LLPPLLLLLLWLPLLLLLLGMGIYDNSWLCASFQQQTLSSIGGCMKSSVQT
jgi:hypothetical protein